MTVMITPKGRYLGRIKDSPNAGDARFRQMHRELMWEIIPPFVDLSPKLPPCFNQGQLGSCGPNSGIGLMAYFFPGFMGSRLALYYAIRAAEGDIGQDGGVMTRDVLGQLVLTGAMPESEWPYDITKFAEAPPPPAEPTKKLTTSSRLNSAQEYLQCLGNSTSAAPFILGFNVPHSLESDLTEQTGIMLSPDIAEPEIGGHDVLAVGLDLNFRSSKVVQKAGIDPTLVSEHALKIRNSWGADWGDEGHFWMPLRYAVDISTGADAWTGRV